MVSTDIGATDEVGTVDAISLPRFNGRIPKSPAFMIIAVVVAVNEGRR